MKRTDKGKQQGQEKEIVTVRGVVAPSEWDGKDDVTAVTIYAHDETEYLVTSKYVVKRLMEHVDEEVEATGFLSQDEYGEDVFIVSDFAALEKDEEEEDQEWDDDWDEDEDDEDDEDDDWDDDEDDEDDEWDDDDEEWDDDEDENDSRKWKRYRYR